MAKARAQSVPIGESELTENRRRNRQHNPDGASLTKRCPRCGTTKPLADFARQTLTNSRPGSYCRLCQREYSHEHYLRNTRKHNLRRLANQRRYRLRNKELMDSRLAKECCVDCGESNRVVLEFDHVRGKKIGDISTMVGRAFTWKKIEDEMAKCEVRCANCHRRRTADKYWRPRT